MSARKLFEQLDFILQNETQYEITYINKNFITETNVVNFDLNTKTIECFIECDSPFNPNVPYPMNVKLLKAINQQVEELGWNNG